MATILNRQVTFATNGTVTAAGLHNLIDQTEIYAGIITTQDQIASVGSSDQLLIADADETSTSAPRRVTVGSMFNDALNNGIYTTGSFTNRVTAGSFVGNLTGNVTGTIVGTTGTIATLNSTTSTITNLSATTSTFLGTITGSTNIINIGGGQIYKDGSGNVGMGTTNPSTYGVGSKLVVNGAITSGSINYSATFSDGTTNQLRIGHVSGVANILTDANAVAICTAGTSEQIRIGGDKVGIGTSVPTDKLTVFGNSFLNYDGSSGLLFRKLSSENRIDSYDYPITSGYPLAILGSAIRFQTGTTSASEAMRIDSSGNVGIGTTGPTDRLTVFGNSFLNYDGSSGLLFRKLSGENRIDSYNYPITAGYPLNILGSQIKLGDASGARLTIDTSGNVSTTGNVSIGTATALSMLHVHGDLTMSNATTSTTGATGGVSKPATYAGFLTVSINGTSRKIPYYA
jgi:hypothetical protein